MLLYCYTYFRQRVSAMAQARKNYSSGSRSGSALVIGLLWAVVAFAVAAVVLAVPAVGGAEGLAAQEVDSPLVSEQQVAGQQSVSSMPADAVRMYYNCTESQGPHRFSTHPHPSPVLSYYLDYTRVFSSRNQSSCSGYVEGDYVLRIDVKTRFVRGRPEGYIEFYSSTGLYLYVIGDFSWNRSTRSRESSLFPGGGPEYDLYENGVKLTPGTYHYSWSNRCNYLPASEPLMIGDNSFAASGPCSMGLSSAASIYDRIYFLNDRVEGLPGIIFWRTDQPELHLVPPRFSRAWPPLARVVRLEVTQGVQDWNNSLTLVRNRRTVVRAFIESNLGKPRYITASLKGQKIPADNDFPIAETINPVESGMFVKVMDNVVDRRGDIGASLNFVLPEHWTDLEANEQLRLELVPEQGSNVNCLDGLKIDTIENRCAELVEFTEVLSPIIVMVPVPMRNLGNKPEPSEDDMEEQFKRLVSIMPFANLVHRTPGHAETLKYDFSIDFGPFDRTLENINDDDDKENNDSKNLDLRLVNSALKQFRAHTYDPANSIFLGVISGRSGSQFTGLANSNSQVASWFINEEYESGFTGFARNRGAHEFGHVLNQPHPGMREKNEISLKGACDEPIPSSAEEYPFFHNFGTEQNEIWRPVLGPLKDSNTPIDDEVWGIDTRYIDLTNLNFNEISIDDINALAVVNPYEVFSVLSYCNPFATKSQGKWMDAYHHENIIRDRSILRNSNSLTTEKDNVKTRNMSALFSGSVILSSSGVPTGVELDPIHYTPRSTNDSSDGKYALNFRNASGITVKSVAFSAESSNIDIKPGEAINSDYLLNYADFAFFVNDLPEHDSIVIVYGEREIAKFNFSSNSPNLTVSGIDENQIFNNSDIIDIAWQGNDVDEDNLDYHVYYSINGGITYKLLSLAGDATSKNVSARTLAGSNQARIGVSVSDGYRSSFVETPIFSVSKHVPTVEIQRPFPNVVLAESQGFLLDASGYDIEDGLLPSSAFTWTSNVDGTLGVGSYLVLSADQLTLGGHTINVTATDSDNMTATATVDITIAARNMLPVAYDDEAFGGLEETLLIDVLANDIDTEGDFDLSSLTINRRPVLGIAEIVMTEMGKPVIEYSPITGGEETFTYSICDGLYRCNTAEVTVVFPDCTITGTRGSDNLVGTSGADVICGLDGDDTIDGKGGDDLIYAGFGEDLVYGRTGDDTIYGGPGNDLILGHRGDDTIYGGLSNDRLWGGGGDDTIYGGAEIDEVYGEADNDTIYGGDGPDTIHGGRGDDVIYGGNGDDTIRGNAGADMIYLGSGSDTVLGNSQADTVINDDTQ